MQPEYFMDQALQEAEKAAQEGEVPVGAVVVYQEKVIGRGRNRIESLQDPTAHAEIIALGAAAGTLGSWRLLDCTLYVTLEPCMMCLGAMLAGRLPSLVYGAADPRLGACGGWANLLADNPYHHPLAVQSGVLAEASAKLLQEFFAKLREKQ